jgi:hypothetical protein
MRTTISRSFALQGFSPKDQQVYNTTKLLSDRNLYSCFFGITRLYGVLPRKFPYNHPVLGSYTGIFHIMRS